MIMETYFNKVHQCQIHKKTLICTIQYQSQELSDYYHKLLSLYSSNGFFSTYYFPVLTFYILTYLI